MQLTYPGAVREFGPAVDLVLAQAQNDSKVAVLRVDKANTLSWTCQLENRDRRAMHLFSLMLIPSQRCLIATVQPTKSDDPILITQFSLGQPNAVVFDSARRAVCALVNRGRAYSLTPFRTQVPKVESSSIIIPGEQLTNSDLNYVASFAPVEFLRLPAPSEELTPGYLPDGAEVSLFEKGSEVIPIEADSPQRFSLDYWDGVSFEKRPSGEIAFEGPFVNLVQRLNQLCLYVWTTAGRHGPPWGGFRISQDAPRDVELFNGQLLQVGKLSVSENLNIAAVGSNHVMQML